MAEEEKRTDTETGFGTGLRAKLGQRDADESVAPEAVATVEAAPVEAPQANGGVNGDIEALRAELAAALARERDLRTELAVASQPIAPSADLSPLEAQLNTRSAELDARGARLAAAETELQERERRISEQVAIVRAEKERLSELENRVVAQDALSSERESQAEAKLRQLKDAEREHERLEHQLQKHTAAFSAQPSARRPSRRARRK
jgi:chromosome segregation ATPase